MRGFGIVPMLLTMLSLGAWPCSSQAANSLAIQITDKVTSEPLSGVQVSAQVDRTKQQLKADDQGRITLSFDAAPRGLRITATKARYVPTTVSWREGSNPPIPQSLTLPLDPAVVIGGIIQDE